MTTISLVINLLFIPANQQGKNGIGLNHFQSLGFFCKANLKTLLDMFLILNCSICYVIICLCADLEIFAAVW